VVLGSILRETRAELPDSARCTTVTPVPYRRTRDAGSTCDLKRAEAVSKEHQDEIYFTLRPHVYKLDDKSDGYGDIYTFLC